MARRTLRDSGDAYRDLHRLLHDGFVEMVAAFDPIVRIEIQTRCRKHPLPSPFPVGVGILPRDGIRQCDSSGRLSQVFFVQLPHPIEVTL